MRFDSFASRVARSVDVRVGAVARGAPSRRAALRRVGDRRARRGRVRRVNARGDDDVRRNGTRIGCGDRERERSRGQRDGGIVRRYTALARAFLFMIESVENYRIINELRD